MVNFKEEMLMTLFGGKKEDYDMLDKCIYNFEDILDYVKLFTSVDKMDFYDVLVGAIDLYKRNLQDTIDNKIEETEDDIKYLENKIECCAYDKYDEMKLHDLWEKKEKLEELETFDDIQHDLYFMIMYIEDEEIKAIYKEYLKEEIENENENIGFIKLDLGE